MARTRQGDRETGRPGERAAALLSLLGWLSPCLLVCFLAGCAHDNRPADPLAGAGGGATPAIGSAIAPAVPVAPVVPPVPVVGGATQSTAALASSNGARPLAGGTDLRIGNTSTGNWQGQSAGTGATLQPPDPAIQPVSRARGVSPGGARATNYEQAMALLVAKGVKWRKLETVGERNESKFSCSIPNSQNPNISRYYEASAATDLAAIQAVLDQIEKDSAGGL